VAKPVVIQAEELDAAAAEWLGKRCELIVCPFGEASKFDEHLRRAHGLVVRTYAWVNQALLDRAPNLKVIGRAGVGLDRIDVTACRARGVEVVYTPDANSEAVAEYVFALLFQALRPTARAAAMDLEEWHGVRRKVIAPRELNELTLGILGLGRAGSRVARIGAGFGMPVLYHDLGTIEPEKRHGAREVTLEALLARSDILSVHVDGRPGNRGLINAALLAQLGPRAIVVNTSRGMVVDALALASWLGANPGAMALLDVHEPEPIAVGYPLLGLPNARLYPHLGAGTARAHGNMSWVVRDVARVLEGERPRHPAP
jgi:phosphoglycerate dehydrogenase-like enzyme